MSAPPRWRATASCARRRDARGRQPRGRSDGRARVARLADRLRRPGDHGRRHARAGPPHPQRRRDARRPLRRLDAGVAAREQVAAEPAMAGSTSPASSRRTRSRITARKQRPADRRDRHGNQALDRPRDDCARRPPGPAPLHRQRAGADRRRSRRDLPGQRPGRPRGAGVRRRHRARARGGEAGVRHLPRASAALPGDRPGDLQAALRASRGKPPGQGPAHGADRDHLAEPWLRGRGPDGGLHVETTTRCAGRRTSAPPSCAT